MRLEEAKEIIACLPAGKTRFYYFKDRYALLLLGLFVESPKAKRDVKASGLGRLLEKPTVRAAIRRATPPLLSAEVFEGYWPGDYECYLLTLGTWGSKNRHRDQVSRPGYNLVLQLNFSSRHDEPYTRLLQPDERHPYEYSLHPVNGKQLRTLAWSRLDVDLDAGEALIEEIQTDWIRGALSDRRLADQRADDNVVRYVDEVLAPHIPVWDEAMLAATIWFLRRELGISTIFYHTYESGAALKRIRYGRPPRSVYTRLPRKFCFAETASKPSFLAGTRKPGKARRLVQRARFRVLTLQ